MTSFDGLLSMIKLVGYPMTGLFDRRKDQFEVSSHLFSRWLRLISVLYMFEINMGDGYNFK